MLHQFPNATSSPSTSRPCTCMRRHRSPFSHLDACAPSFVSQGLRHVGGEGCLLEAQTRPFLPRLLYRCRFPLSRAWPSAHAHEWTKSAQLMAPPRPHCAPLCEKMMTASCKLVPPSALQMVLGTCLKHQYFLGCHDMSVESMIWNILGLTLIPSWFYALGPGYANGPAWFMGTLFWLWCSLPKPIP
jgi:hypothetical protein